MPVYLVSKQRRKLIFRNFEETNVFTQFIGLMFRSAFSKPLLFKGSGRIAIHSFFCPPFDAVFLDKNGKVVRAAVMNAGKVMAVNAFYLFEFPAGAISRFRLKKGDEIKWRKK